MLQHVRRDAEPGVVLVLKVGRQAVHRVIHRQREPTTANRLEVSCRARNSGLFAADERAQIPAELPSSFRHGDVDAPALCIRLDAAFVCQVLPAGGAGELAQLRVEESQRRVVDERFAKLFPSHPVQQSEGRHDRRLGHRGGREQQLFREHPLLLAHGFFGVGHHF